MSRDVCRHCGCLGCDAACRVGVPSSPAVSERVYFVNYNGDILGGMVVKTEVDAVVVSCAAYAGAVRVPRATLLAVPRLDAAPSWATAEQAWDKSRARECSICRGVHGPEISHTCE